MITLKMFHPHSTQRQLRDKKKNMTGRENASAAFSELSSCNNGQIMKPLGTTFLNYYMTGSAPMTIFYIKITFVKNQGKNSSGRRQSILVLRSESKVRRLQKSAE